MFKHYPDGVISHIAGPDGGVMQYAKDDKNRIAQQILPSGVVIEWCYDPDGKHTHRRDQFGRLFPPEDQLPELPSPLEHDGPETQRDWLLGRPQRGLPEQSTVLPLSVKQALAQLAPANPAGSAEPQPVRDVLARVIEQAHLDGTVERFQHDGEGNVIAHQDTKGNWSYRKIVSWNLLGAEQSALGAVKQYEYTHQETRRTWVDGNGNRTDYMFDLRHRSSEIHRQGALFESFVRDSHGTVIEAKDATGNALVTRQSGAQGLPVSTELVSGEKYTFNYDDFGNPKEASSSEHEVMRETLRRFFFHSLSHRLIEHRDGIGVRHGYDGSRRLLHTVYFERFCVEYRLLRSGKQRVFTPVGGYHDFSRSSGGEMVRENGNGTSEAILFDNHDLMCSRACWRQEDVAIGPRWTTRYFYNAERELLVETDTETGQVRYGYDADHQLVLQQDARGPRQYAYDAAGNLTYSPNHRTIERQAGNLLHFSDAERFEYDERKRLCKRTRWDGIVIDYLYDSAGQLVEARFSDRQAVWRAAYDGHGRRIWREYDGRRTDFYWDDDRLMAEVAPDGRVRLYVYSNTDALVPFMWIDYASVEADPESGKPHFIFVNGTGMPVRVENELGDEVWRANHIDPYGLVEVDEGAEVDVRLRFAGHFYDEHTGLHYNRFRDYDPSLGRYLQPDPIDMAGGINLYAYPSNPVVDVDLRGLVHRKRPGPRPHRDIPLEDMTDEQLKDVCKYHADNLADYHENVFAKPDRRRFRNHNTFSVGVIEDASGSRRLVATMNDGTPNDRSGRYMQRHGIEDATGGRPRLARRQQRDARGRPTGETETYNRDTGNVHDKSSRSSHHAERRMRRAPGEGETLVAQSPSQPCCSGCQRALGRPDANGNRPLDQIPADRQR